MIRSTDGGASWIDISVDANGNGPHSDEHAAIIDSQGRLLVGNDGGIWRWDPSKALWTNLNGGGLAITTFNGITTSPINPDFVLGGSQDNGTEKFTGDQAWEHVDDGDGGIVRFDLNDPNIAYHVLNGRLQKSIDGGNTWSTVMPVARSLYFPFLVDPISSRVVVATSSPTFGATPLQESLDGGATWIDLSSAIPGFPSINAFAIASYQGNRPDGTYQFDPAFPLVGDKGANTYDPDTIYIANGGSQLFVTKDHAQSWVDRTPNLPGIGTIVDVTVDPRNRDTVYVVTQGVPGSGANRVLKSTDAGQTWTDITNNMVDIPGPSTDIPLWKVVIDPRDGTLYLGSDQGVWRLKNGSGSWDRFGAGMPNVQVKELDLNLNLNILTAGTYGRSAFQIHLDDPQADSGAVRATSGLSTWTGPVHLAADATFGVGGSQALLERRRGRHARHRRRHRRHGRGQLPRHQGWPGHADLLGQEHLRRSDRGGQWRAGCEQPRRARRLPGRRRHHGEGRDRRRCRRGPANAVRSRRRADRPEWQWRGPRLERPQLRRAPQHQRQQHLHRHPHAGQQRHRRRR